MERTVTIDGVEFKYESRPLEDLARTVAKEWRLTISDLLPARTPHGYRLQMKSAPSGIIYLKRPERHLINRLVLESSEYAMVLAMYRDSTPESEVLSLTRQDRRFVCSQIDDTVLIRVNNPSPEGHDLVALEPLACTPETFGKLGDLVKDYFK